VPALPQPHLPRILSLALAAAAVAMLIALYAAPRLGDIHFGSATAAPAPVPRTTVEPVLAARPSGSLNPFAVPFRVRLPWPAPKV
jgi:hypothetical protein